MKRNLIPFFKPCLGAEEEELVRLFFHQTFEEQVEWITKFENHFCEHYSFPAALAVSSGTAALHLALCALEIKKGDEIIVPDIMCPAVLNVIENVGAKPVFVDVQERFGNIDPEKIPSVVKPNKTKAIIVVHYGGHPASIQEVIKIGKKYHLFVIEDAAQALEAYKESKMCGTFADLAIFSFYANKHFTCAEGGMLVGKKTFIQKAREHLYQSRGLYRLPGTSFLDYQIHPLLAAIATQQLKKSGQFLTERQYIAECYFSLLKSCSSSFLLPKPDTHTAPSWHQFGLQYKPKQAFCLKWRQQMITHLKKQGVLLCLEMQPAHCFKFYAKKYGGKDRQFPNALRFSNSRLLLPIYPGLSVLELERIASGLVKTIREFEL
jgi:perosamine synthetase